MEYKPKRSPIIQIVMLALSVAVFAAPFTSASAQPTPAESYARHALLLLL